MYLVLLHRTGSMDDMMRVFPEHYAWLVDRLAEGKVLVAGPSTDRKYGVLLAPSMPRDEFDAMIAGDPFVIKNVGKHEVIDFVAGVTADALTPWRDESH